MDLSDKIFTNRKISEEEFSIIKSIFIEDSFADLLNTHFMYLYFDKQGYIRFLSIDDRAVEKICEKYCFSHKEACEFIYMKDEIEQEVGEMLYWLDIDDYKKYVPVQRYKQNGEREYADYFLYSKSEIEANEYLYRNGYFDYIFLEDVDA
jgi:hypothetical protein